MIFAAKLGEIVDRGSYLVIRTPSNPEYHWGNFLVFPNSPVAGDEKIWPEIFREEFKGIPGINHVALTWDSREPGGNIDDFTSLGYKFEVNVSLMAREVHLPVKCNSIVECRPMESAADWEAAIQNQLSANAEFDPAIYETFKRQFMVSRRDLALQGMGKWFGAFWDGHLVADLGVFFEGPIARFQTVVTNPNFQRRGICGRLVYEAARYALRNFGVDTLVMVADESYHAARIYESVGFVPSDRTYQLSWWR
jgi:GNAT superfamily N-acetyltransferase